MIAARTRKNLTEKRDTERFKVRDAFLGYAEAGLLVYKAPRETPYQLLNISMSGVEFVSTKRVEQDTKVDLAISCPAFLNPMVCRGQVVRIRRVTQPRTHYRIVVKFSKMERRAKSQLNALSNDPMIRKLPKGSPYIA